MCAPLPAQANRTQARVAFVRHNVETDYGDTSDLSRIHSVRAVSAEGGRVAGLAGGVWLHGHRGGAPVCLQARCSSVGPCRLVRGTGLAG